MILANDVIEYIEKRNNVLLFDYQKKFLANLIEGKTTRMPRGAGTSFLVEGYGKYLNHIFFRAPYSIEDFDDNIYLEDVLPEPILSGMLLRDHYGTNPELFEREYNVRYMDKISESL